MQWMPKLQTIDIGEVAIRFTAGNIKSTYILNILGRTEKGEWLGKQVEIPIK
jgi:hypothetical protein